MPDGREEFRYDAVIQAEDVTREIAREIQAKLSGEMIEVTLSDGLVYEVQIEHVGSPWT